MSRITKFSQIPAQLKYPPQYKGKLSQIHSEIISAILTKHEVPLKELKQTVRLMNTISYQTLQGDKISWTAVDPLNYSNLLEDSDIRSYLVKQDMYIAFTDINWDSDDIVKLASNSSDVTASVTPSPVAPNAAASVASVSFESTSRLFVTPTPKEDLYLRPPVIPRFSTSAIFASAEFDGVSHCIYSSLPIIPRTQTEISITTDVMQMTSKDILQLYPNHFIRTRAAALYESISNLEMLPDLGAVLPISHFTREQVIDNIIKYPHLYKLMKQVDGQIVSFYTTIEVDGKLERTADIWSMLPESELIPYNSDYIKEYVIRRYLLERDIDNVVHKYPLFGTLDPFLTLFTTVKDYIDYGYPDVEDIGRQCVKARVSYKQSRNPILRRLKNA